ncbi:MULTISPECIES: hypothetical protein [Enterobacterales]|uniref:hypothetical protein n=1 Tax=Enterobacterales TaxID=91347 RepID=UPI0012D3F57E|nr:hypothetical protein [Hafnia alvei]
MKVIKIINIFKAKKHSLYDLFDHQHGENEKGINLTLENGENICIKDYGRTSSQSTPTVVFHRSPPPSIN